MATSFKRTSLAIVVGLVVAVTSFCTTLWLPDYRNRAGVPSAGDANTAAPPPPPQAPTSTGPAPVAPAPPGPTKQTGPLQPSTTATLPQLTVSGPLTFAWDRVVGLNVGQSGDKPVASNLPVMKLAPLPSRGEHALGLQLRGLPGNRAYRVTAWVQAPPQVNAALIMRDDKPIHCGLAPFDLDALKAVTSTAT
jgi:hypothetical protein